jgi:hypothetical protein
MVAEFSDSFKGADRSLSSDSNYTVPCGSVAVIDEAARPISVDASGGFGEGISPVDLLTTRRTQLIYAGTLDRQDLNLRAVFGHDQTLPGGTTGNAVFSILARASKDSLLLQLGGDEEPLCYDQGYALRFEAQTNATAAKLSIVKLMPAERVGGSRSATDQPDDAIELATVAVQAGWLNQRSSFSGKDSATTGLAYTGMWQDMSLRIWGRDGEVHLEAYLNDRFQNVPVLRATDRATPTWDQGSAGIEFWSPEYTDQPSEASPFDLAAQSVMACALFELQTIQAFAEPRRQQSAYYTYGRVVDRVTQLVEKDGEIQYASPSSGRQTRRSVYLDFVLDAEAQIIRGEGYYDWLRREQELYLEASQDLYEMPADFGLLDLLRPGNWQGAPLDYLRPYDFRRRLGNLSRNGGLPRIYTDADPAVNLNERMRVYPVPRTQDITNKDGESLYMTVEYYRKRIRPTIDELDVAVPVIPQEHMDVLIYGAAAHALLLDTDQANVQMFNQAFAVKIRDLRRDNNRFTNQRMLLRSAADVRPQTVTSRLPLLRSTQLEVLLA